MVKMNGSELYSGLQQLEPHRQLRNEYIMIDLYVY